jgi:putative molybdopterin biosynthesis protein
MKDIRIALSSLARQEQFLEVVDRDEAKTRFQKHLRMGRLGVETAPLSEASGRVVARAVIADVDVPGFDRSQRRRIRRARR